MSKLTDVNKILKKENNIHAAALIGLELAAHLQAISPLDATSIRNDINRRHVPSMQVLNAVASAHGLTSPRLYSANTIIHNIEAFLEMDNLITGWHDELNAYVVYSPDANGDLAYICTVAAVLTDIYDTPINGENA